MAKAKPADEQLEDEVWCLLAQMGFKEMSQGRQFTFAVGPGIPRRQIDVFAKDDETAIVVECTQRETPAKQRMTPLIDKIEAIRDDLRESIRKTFGRQSRLKIRFAIATRNVGWRDVDRTKCAHAQIAVIADGELDYYRALVQHLKCAARYQFLGHMFEGQRVAGLDRKVIATRGKMGGERFFTFLIRPDELLKIAYVGHKASRDTDDLETYQRMLQPRRLKKIAEYINAGHRFPTNIVVNLKTTRRGGLLFEASETYGEVALGTLHLPPNYGSAWIIDGQHRLYGYAYARAANGFQKDSTVLPVLAYENLASNKEMNLFIDINSKQVKVSTGLLVELYADLHWNSADPDEAFQALLSRIASRLNSEKVSPLHDRMVVTGKKKNSYRCLTQTSIRDGLDVSKLLGTFGKGSIVPGPLSTSNADDYEANLGKVLSVLTECLNLFASQLSTHWELGDAPGGYLCTNNGIRALFHVMKDVTDHIRHTDGTDLCFFSADDAVEEIKPYLQALVDYFKGAAAQEVQSFRRIGSSLAAVRQQAYGLEVQIKGTFPTFAPAGLQEYLESRDEVGTQEAGRKVLAIQKRLFDYVVATLKNHYGTENDAWWTKGIPVSIRKDCMNRWEEKDREGQPESQLYLISYVGICHHSWNLFKNVISLDAVNKDNRKANTKWITKLNDIRAITTHPERGVLSTDQVAFVNEHVDKVETYFPAAVN